MLVMMIQMSLGRPSEGDEVPMLEAEEENCIPLRWCDPLMYLVNSIRDNNIPAGHTRAQIVQQLRATTCSIEDDQVIVCTSKSYGDILLLLFSQ